MVSRSNYDDDDDSASVLSVGTLNKIINKDIPTVQDVEKVIRGDTNKKRSGSDDDHEFSSSLKRVRPDIIDCVGYITPIKGTKESVSSDDSDNETAQTTNVLPLTSNVLADLFPAKKSKDIDTKTKSSDDDDDDADDDKENIEDSNVQCKSKVVYLPGTIERLREKLLLLLAEFEAGNTATRNEIVAILDELWNRNAIDEQSYIDFNNRIPIKGKGLKTDMIQDTVKYLIAHDKKELMKLLKEFKKTSQNDDDDDADSKDTVGTLEDLVITFLEPKDEDADAEAEDELALTKIDDALRKLQTTKILKSKLHRVKMLLSYIDRNRYRIQSIISRLADAETERERMAILEQLTREGLLSNDQFEKLDALKEVDLPRVVDIIKETKIGHGIKFLPSTVPDLKERLHHLLTDDSIDTELSYIKREIHALLEELLRRKAISDEQYSAIKEDNKMLY